MSTLILHPFDLIKLRFAGNFIMLVTLFFVCTRDCPLVQYSVVFNVLQRRLDMSLELIT